MTFTDPRMKALDYQVGGLIDDLVDRAYTIMMDLGLGWREAKEVLDGYDRSLGEWFVEWLEANDHEMGNGYTIEDEEAEALAAELGAPDEWLEKPHDPTQN